MAKRTVLFWPAQIAFAKVFAHLGGVDIESGNDLYITDVVAPQFDVHQSRDIVSAARVTVILEALHEGTRAITYACYRQTHFCH